MTGGKQLATKFASKLLKEVEKSANPKLAEGMKKYMRDQFEYLGLQSTERRTILKEVYKNTEGIESADDVFIDEFANECLKSKYREMRYSFTDFLIMYYKKKLNVNNLKKMEEFNIKSKWWDVTDALAGSFGVIFAADADLQKKKNEEYITHENLWMRRIGILHQLKYKEKTNTDILYGNILKTCSEKEFFIRKAIGWALREYSKTAPHEVVSFIEKHKDKLDAWSKKEGMKYIEENKHILKK